MTLLKIGIIREEKVPQDSRVPLSPKQCKSLMLRGIDIVVQPSDHRCFTNEEYEDQEIKMSEDLTDRDILLGVKEVPIENLIENKTYFFFSHTIKEQPYNRKLLQSVLKKHIRLIDYEVLTNDNGARVIAFGQFAGMVGAHNALWTYGKKTKQFDLPRMKDLKDYNEAKSHYDKSIFPPVKIVLTGTGRVASGAAMVLDDMGIKKVTPIDYVTHDFDFPVYTQLNSFFYAKRKDGKIFDAVQDFYEHPYDYESDFYHFLPMTDIMINGIFWDNQAPAFFNIEQMKSEDFNIKVISDVTCDIAPVSSIPSTLRATTIADPVFGFDPYTGKETTPYTENSIDMMTIDNLPNELPRDASIAFGEMFIDHVFEELNQEYSTILDRATIAIGGKLGPNFQYLHDYVSKK
jgi:alanine dehydrogenase